MAIVKNIKIDGREVVMRASALVPRLYRVKFGRDMIADLSKVEQSLKKSTDDGSDLDVMDLTIFENLAWAMAKHASPEVPSDPDEWLDSFDGVFSIYEVLPEILDLWSQSMKQTSVPAKK